MKNGYLSPALGPQTTFAFLLCLLCLFPFPIVAQTLVGVSRKTITPAVGSDKPPVWIAGYGHGRQATGVHDELWSRSLVVSVGGGIQQKTVALVSLDLIGYHYPEVLKIRADLGRIHQEMKVDHLVVACTHVHEGPDTIGLWGKTEQQSGIDPAYLEFVNSTVVQTVAEAYKVRQPAQIRFGCEESRGYLEDTRLPIVKDQKVCYLHAQGLTGETIGTVVNWSSHPEVMGGGNTWITSDYPHYLRASLEKVLGGTTIFFVGSIGGLLTSEGVVVEDPTTHHPAGEHSWRKAQIIGEGVAETVIGGIRRSQPMPVDRLDIHSRVIYLPLTNIHFRLAAGLHLLPRQFFTNGALDLAVEPGQKWGVPFEVPTGREIQSEVNAITLGPAQILGVPGEIYPELVIGGIQTPQDPGADFQGAPREEPPLRSLMKARYQFILGLANDEVGYIIPKSQWDEKPPYAYGRKEPQYGEVNSCGYEVAPIITSALRGLLTGR